MSDLLIITSYRWSSIATTKWAATARQMALDTKSFTILPYIPFTASPRFFKPEELQAFRETLMAEIRSRAPKALLVFGDHAFAALTGHYGGKRSIKYMRGFCLPSYAGIPCVGTFDLETFSKSEGRIFPQQSKLMGLIMSDISTALAVARGRISPCLDPSTEVRVHSGVDRLKELVKKVESDPTLLLAYDLETVKSSTEDEDELYDFDRDNNLVDEGESEDEPEEKEWVKGELDTTKATITTVQFAIDDREGWTVDWDRDSIPLVKRLLESPNPKATQNGWLFDNPILYRHNCQISGPNHDTLWMWHSLQPDLPAHLQGIAQSVGWSFPWKHMSGTHFEFYGVVDVCAVIRIMSHLPNQLRAVGNWEWYDRLNREFFVVLEEMRGRGIPVDASKLTEFRTRLTSEISTLNDEIQSLVPSFLRKPDPPNGYVTPPEDVKTLIRTNHSHLFEPTTKVCKNGAVKTVASKVKVSDCYRQICEGDEEFSSTIEQVKSLGYQFIPFDDSTRIARITDWNVGSSKQILEYLKLKGYPIPTRFRDGKATTSDKELDKLWSKTKDPILAKVRETRIRQKMRSSYTGKEKDGRIVGGWYPEFDGRLRAVIGFGPATGQLSAKGVNVMTTPKRRKDMAKAFRKCIVAPDGYKLISFDFKSFHALTTALEARDHLLMRLSTLDVHSFVAGHLVKFPGIETCTDMNDADLAAYLLEIRKAHPNIRDFQAKPAVHGTNFGQKHRRLYFEYRDHFESEAHAKRLLDLLQELFPNLFKWQEAICLKAHEDKQLISRWGAIRRFWEVKRYERTLTGWKTVNGRDAEKAKAFLPSNDAHGMFRDKVLQAHERGWCERYGLSNLIHDDTLWLCPDTLVEECIENVRTLLSSPVPQLADPEMCPNGFVCGVDCSVGQDWASMEEVK